MGAIDLPYSAINTVSYMQPHDLTFVLSVKVLMLRPISGCLSSSRKMSWLDPFAPTCSGVRAALPAPPTPHQTRLFSLPQSRRHSRTRPRSLARSARYRSGSIGMADQRATHTKSARTGGLPSAEDGFAAALEISQRFRSRKASRSVG